MKSKVPATPAPSGIRGDLLVNVPFASLDMLNPKQLQAFMRGVGEVISAQGRTQEPAQTEGKDIQC